MHVEVVRHRAVVLDDPALEVSTVTVSSMRPMSIALPLISKPSFNVKVRVVATSRLVEVGNRVQPIGHLRAAIELVGRAHLEHVEGISAPVPRRDERSGPRSRGHPRLQHHALAGGHPQQHLGPLPRREPHVVEFDGCLEQSAVAGDELDRPAVAEAKRSCGPSRRSGAAVAPPRRDVEEGTARAVHEELVAEPAGEAARPCSPPPSEEKPASCTITGTSSTPYSLGRPSACSASSCEEEHSGESARDVRPRSRHAGAGGTRASPPAGRCPTRATTWHPGRPSGGDRRPSRRAGACRASARWCVLELVRHVDTHALAALRDEGRAEVGAVEAPCVARHARRELGGARLRVELKTRVPSASTLDSASGGMASGVSKSTLPTVETGVGPTRPHPANATATSAPAAHGGEGADGCAGATDPEAVRARCGHGSSLANAPEPPQPVGARIGAGVFPRWSARAVREASGEQGRRHRHPAQVVDGCRERVELDDGEVGGPPTRTAHPGRRSTRRARPPPRSPAPDATARARRGCGRRPPRSRPTGRAARPAHPIRVPSSTPAAASSASMNARSVRPAQYRSATSRSSMACSGCTLATTPSAANRGDVLVAEQLRVLDRPAAPDLLEASRTRALARSPMACTAGLMPAASARRMSGTSSSYGTVASP